MCPKVHSIAKPEICNNKKLDSASKSMTKLIMCDGKQINPKSKHRNHSFWYLLGLEGILWWYTGSGSSDRLQKRNLEALSKHVGMVSRVPKLS